jgi:hypothetical protein
MILLDMAHPFASLSRRGECIGEWGGEDTRDGDG